MVSFEIFVKAMPPSLSELKVLPSFCFPIKIRDDRAVTSNQLISKDFLVSFLRKNERKNSTYVIVIDPDYDTSKVKLFSFDFF